MKTIKPEVVKHTYINGIELTIVKEFCTISVYINKLLIGKRYLSFLWTILPSQVYPKKFSSYDDRVIKQIVNEVFDGAL